MNDIKDTYDAIYQLGYRGWLGLLRAFRDGILSRNEYEAIKIAAGGMPVADVVSTCVFAY